MGLSPLEAAMNHHVTNVIIAGLGGQGVLKASDILAEAAFFAGLDVKKAEVHGMSQRGGSVTSDVRFGPRVLSPMVPPGEADFLVVLAEDEVESHRACLRRRSFAHRRPDRSRHAARAAELESGPLGRARCAVGHRSTLLAAGHSQAPQARVARGQPAGLRARPRAIAVCRGRIGTAFPPATSRPVLARRRRVATENCRAVDGHRRVGRRAAATSTFRER